MCNIIEKGTYKFVYRRYASLYFVVGVPLGMNELIVLEQIHLFVEALDGYFNSGKYAFIVEQVLQVQSGIVTSTSSMYSTLGFSLSIFFFSLRIGFGIFVAQVASDFV